MAHDFKNFPELRDSEMELYYFASPHKQITQDFRAKVVKVHDGDTITLRWHERNFDFPLRLLYIDTAEIGEPGGEKARSWLEGKLLNEEVDILLRRGNRVDKWGRLLGVVMHGGISINEESLRMGISLPFEQRKERRIRTIAEVLKA